MWTRGLVAVVCLATVGIGRPCWAQAPAASPAAAFPPEVATAPKMPTAATPAPSPAAAPSGTTVGGSAPEAVGGSAPEATAAPLPASPAAQPVAAPPHAPMLMPDRNASDGEPAARRAWSLGAGVGVGLGAAYDGSSVLTPNYHTALERRLSDNNWLLLNLSVAHDTIELPATTSSTGVTTDGSNTTLAALLGLRHVFVHGVVDVSLFGAVLGQYRNLEYGVALLAQQGGLGPSAKLYSLGFQGGLAVERELAEALALRLSVRLASLSIDHGTGHRTDAQGVTQSSDIDGSSFDLYALPALALYFYF